MNRPSMTRRDDSLIGQVVAANVVLVALTLFAASLAAGLDLDRLRPALDVPDPRARDRAHALREPVDAPAPLRAARAPDRADRGDRPRRAAQPPTCPSRTRSRRSTARRARSTGCSSASRRSAAAPARSRMRAQEEERRRLARDLHDEVNQALTAILLRLEALAQDSPARNMGRGRRAEAAREPGDGGAAQPRAPAAPDRARRPRPGAGDRDPAQALLGAHRRRGDAWTRDGDPDALARGRADGGLPGRPGGARERRPPRRRHRRGPSSSRRTASGSSCASATTARASTRRRSRAARTATARAPASG